MAYLREWGPVLVTGGTGQQGGATARALLSQSIPVLALVRDPDASGAVRLRELGARLVVGDLDDEASLREACAGVYGVFSVQNPDYANLEGDTEKLRGRNLVQAAIGRGVTHFVQTSVTGAGDYYRRGTDWLESRGQQTSMVSKGYIEDLVRDAGFPYWTILKYGMPAFPTGRS